MSISNLTKTLCWKISVCWARSIALLMNGFFSLFGPGNSVAKWLLLETSTWKLWMAATALVIVMNAMLVVAADAVCHSRRQTRLIWHWPFLLIQRFTFLRQLLELPGVHYDNPLFVFCFFLHRAKLTVSRIKRPRLLISDSVLTAARLFSPEQTCKD